MKLVAPESPDGRISRSYTWGSVDSAFRNKNNVLSPVVEEFSPGIEQHNPVTGNTDSEIENTNSASGRTGFPSANQHLSRLNIEQEVSDVQPNTTPTTSPRRTPSVHPGARNVDPEVTDNVLTLTDKLLGMAKEMYEIVDGQLAKANDMFDVRWDFSVRTLPVEDLQAAVQNPSDDRVFLATNAVNMAEKRLALAKSRLEIIEERLSLARCQVELCERRVELEKESLLAAKKALSVTV